MNAQLNAAVPQANAQADCFQANGALNQGYRGGNYNFGDSRPEPWRYRMDNNRWWYWAPDNRWMAYDNNQWTYFQPGESVTYSPPATTPTPDYTAAYGGTDNAPANYNQAANNSGYSNNCTYSYGGRGYGYRRGWRRW